MALTKISGSILKDPLNLGEVSIGGTLTYQDVTNVDSVGVITARAGVNVSGGQVSVGAGTSLHSTGLDLGTGNITGHNLHSTGIITATAFHGDGSNLSGITQTTINSNAANRIITGSGSANTLNGEANLTWNGTLLNLTGTGSEINLRGPGVTTHEIVANSGDNHWEFINNSGAGNITSDIIFKGSGAGGETVKEKLRIKSNSVKITNLPSGYTAGALLINTDYTNFGHIIVRDQNNANACAIMAENENSGSDEYNRIYRSVNRNSAAWANATLCGKSHTFRISHDSSSGDAFVVKSDKNVVVTNGNFGINTSSPTDRLDVNGTAIIRSNLYLNNNTYLASNKGIYFDGGTGANNYLDDYEEGSWNPTYTTTGGTTGSVSYSHQAGYYVKVGHTVWVMIDITVSSASGMSGNTCIGGFPFQNNVRQGQGYYYAGTMNWYIQNHHSNQPIFTGWMMGNSHLLRIHQGPHWNNLPNAPLNTTGRMSFSLWYTTNS